MKRRTASIPLERGLWCFSGGRDFGEGLTHTGDGAVMQLRRELHAACGKQVDHRGAEFEAAHLGAFFQRDGAFFTGGWVGPAFDDAFARRRDGAGPDGLDAADDGGADRICTIGPMSVSNTQITRSLRANRLGTLAAVSGLTENRSPGT